MPLKTFQDEAPALNMTPMIDIVFLLIIFFMAGTKFSEMEKSLDLEVPGVSSLAALSDAPARQPINVYRDGRVGYDQQVMDSNELADRLRSAKLQYSALGVVVRGDREAPYEYVARVLKACKDAGIDELSISLQLDRQGG